MPALSLSRLALFSLPIALAAPLAFAGDDDDEEEDVKAMKAPGYAPRTNIDFAPLELAAPAASMAATVGGAQDIRYFRDQVAAGQVPHPATFTPEGLFSEHDLPIPDEGGAACRQLLCPVGAATTASLTVQPEVRYLAQLGFHTGIDASTFRRPPLNLVAVVDKSGSMSGQPLELVKKSLDEVVDQLGPDDQLSVVLYGDTVHTFVPPTRGSDKGALHAQIARIASAGSTYMEAGLAHGFALAHESGAHFDGVTRVMLFTDERPNVGRTDAQSFMGMAEAASREGVGMTTIGVGVQFGAELAQKISAVRGGNLFFFADAGAMSQTFEEELDTMVSELAYDLRLRVVPAAGLSIAGVYGIPGEALTWGPDGSMELGVSTLFASHEEGGIYVAFAPATAGAVPRQQVGLGGSVGTVSVSYELRGGQRFQGAADFRVLGGPLPAGLSRGKLLVEEVTTLKKAAALHHEQNDQEGAYRLVHGLRSTLEADRDPEMEPERLLVGKLDETLSKLSGHQGEGNVLTQRDPVTGLPTR